MSKRNLSDEACEPSPLGRWQFLALPVALATADVVEDVGQRLHYLAAIEVWRMLNESSSAALAHAMSPLTQAEITLTRCSSF
jgi:hypothetical protein